MRFKTSLRNIKTFTKFTASLASLGKIAWVRLDNDNVRFTIIPEQGSQVWASLAIDALFMDYTVQSRAENNTINMELPLGPLQAALKSASNGSSASLRLTKRDGDAILSLTIVTHAPASGASANGFLRSSEFGSTFDDYNMETLDGTESGMRETIVTQEIPIRILSTSSVEGIHEPRVRDPDVHILLPPLLSLKAISDRFTKLAQATTAGQGSSSGVPKLELKANMFGTLRMRCHTDQLSIESKWEGLDNPDLDPEQMQGLNGEQHPSEVMKHRGAEAWAGVRIDGKDWGKVLSVGRLGGRVIACFVNEHALILYVYLVGDEDGGEESVITVFYPLLEVRIERKANLGSTTSHRMLHRRYFKRRDNMWLSACHVCDTIRSNSSSFHLPFNHWMASISIALQKRLPLMNDYAP